jgi:SAM-dependent MidA family methyltransferase
LSKTPEQESRSCSLPSPGPDALAHSRQMTNYLLRVIHQAGGSISFSRFMELALYAPGLGYYSAGSAKLGEAGDFVTAPEISPLFSCCLAGQVARVLEELGDADLLELGAGSGIMAADLLGELERLGRLPRRYMVLEVSADLRQRQQTLLETRLPQLVDRVVWLDQLPGNFQGVILANEVMDALPVERFRVIPGGIVARGVTSSTQGLVMADRPPGPALCREWRRILEQLDHEPTPGYTSEICLQLGPWIQALGRSLSRGVLLLIDYGLPRSAYYHPERSDGTLICHYRHRAHHDPLLYPGIQDITAWVDFTRVAEAAVDSGMDIMGFTTQAHFLIGAGIEQLLLRNAPANSGRAISLAGQVRKLTLPGEMGEHFKVIGLSRGLQGSLPGFELRDLTHTL